MTYARHEHGKTGARLLHMLHAFVPAFKSDLLPDGVHAPSAGIFFCRLPRKALHISCRHTGMVLNSSIMPTRIHIYGCFCQSLLLLAFCLAPGFMIPPAHAFQVADGMALLRQEMPANYCALTFDDGPGPYTADLLDLLVERSIVATFFVVGQNAERRPALIRRMLDEGHEVANHSYSHPDLRRLKPESQFLEMKKTQELLQSLGAEVRYFRPPYGSYGPETTAKAETLGMTIMLWSLDSQDWKHHVLRLEKLRSVSPAVQQSFPGMRGVLLFHDTHKSTVEQMPDILGALLAGGCERFVTVSEYMARAPREEEQRLSTEAPHGGRGELPPSARAESMPDAPAGGVPPQLSEDTRSSTAGVRRTLTAHPVQGKHANPQMQAAHGSPGGQIPVAVLEPATPGVVTNGQFTPFPLARTTPHPYAPTDALGPNLRRPAGPPPGILPAHKPDRDTQGMKQGGNDPG
jgi:peptidoglycan/xylan/chitin deacetylase (PgdA/CDA1 family)